MRDLSTHSLRWMRICSGLANCSWRCIQDWSISNSHTSYMMPYISDMIGCVSLKLQLFVCVSEGERSATSIQPARAYEDESPQCLGPCTDGQESEDSLLVLVPHQSPHGTGEYHQAELQRPIERRRRRKFTTSIQPAKAYEDESVIMSGPH